MKFLENAPRFLFFTGKGGVGKTSVACATALTPGRPGKKVLLVSTDPASNVGQVFGVTIGNTITAIPACRACRPWRSTRSRPPRPTGSGSSAPCAACCPRRSSRRHRRAALSGSCTTEIASFNEFTALLADAVPTAGYDHVIFDTAPTGHTIRLLQLPGAWTDFLPPARATPPAWARWPAWTSTSRCTPRRSRPSRTRPAPGWSWSAARRPPRWRRSSAPTRAQPDRDHDAYVVINGVLPAQPPATSDLAQAFGAREAAAIAAMPEAVAALPRDILDLKPGNMVGLPAL